MEKTDSGEYASLFACAFFASLIMLVIIPVQLVVFAATGIPGSIEDWFALFSANPLLGFFHADLFILVNNILISVIYLAFYHTLKGINKGMMQIAVMLGLIGIAAYISSNRTFELFALAREYSGTADADARVLLATAGTAVLSGWQGTAFDAYYVLNGVTLLIVSLLMFRSPLYGKATAAWGLSSGILMMIPSTAGTVGLVFSVLSLIPWYVFAVRFAFVFRKLSAR